MSAKRTQLIITVLFILCLVPSTASSQIQRKIWGLELGRSTRENVKAFLSSNGLEYEEGFGGYDGIAITDLRNLGFGGYSWTPVFNFYNNILYEVDLSRSNLEFDTSTGKEYVIDTKAIFFDLKGKLSNKYRNYEEVQTDKPNSLYVVRDNATVVILELIDNKTLSLEYVDRKLARMAQSGSDL